MYARTAQALAASERMGTVQADDPRIAGNWSLDAIGAYRAWDVSTGEGVTVAVLDTGVDVDHVDLAANLWTNPGEVAGDGIDNDRNGFVDDVHGWNFSRSGRGRDPNDVLGHGTHVAGLIAAEAGNAEGIAGVAPDAEIMAVKVLADNGAGSTFDVVRGIDYAIEMGAKIVNLSLGGIYGSGAYEGALRRAEEAGVIVVAAAGNTRSEEALWPARYAATYDNVVSVAASTRSDAIASYSNWSESRTSVDLAAPGHGLLSTLPGDAYGTKSGTSMAAPVVSGAAAAIWAARPDWDYREVIDAMMRSVDAMSSPGRTTATNGVLDLAEAIALAATATPEPVQASAPRLETRRAPESAPDDFADLAFWLDGTAGKPERLTDLSGRGNDGTVAAGRRAEATEGGLGFDGNTVYGIADTADVNAARALDAFTLSFSFDVGADVTSHQVLYEQGGAKRGLSVTLEDGQVHLSGWNLAEAAWGVETVSVAVAAHGTHAVSLVLDAEAGTLSGYVDGALMGVRDGVGTLYRHKGDIGLGGVNGSTRDVDGDVMRSGQGRFEGVLFEAAAHGAALGGAEIAALHAGLAARASAASSASADAFAFAPDGALQDDLWHAIALDGDAEGAPSDPAPELADLPDLLGVAADPASDLPIG